MRQWVLALAALGMGGCSAPCVHDDTAFRCVEYVRAIDGDTIVVNVHDEHRIIAENLGVRLKNIDTPEIRASEPCEKAKATEAKAFVHNELSGAQRIDLLNIERGKYFRVVANVKADHRYLHRKLIKHHLAVPYDGGTKPAVDWCGIR